MILLEDLKKKKVVYPYNDEKEMKKEDQS